MSPPATPPRAVAEHAGEPPSKRSAPDTSQPQSESQKNDKSPSARQRSPFPASHLLNYHPVQRQVGSAHEAHDRTAWSPPSIDYS
jgi:hypothetical protein